MKGSLMITWTESARAALQRHNQNVRQAIIDGGADPDEVAGDLQRHIEEELLAAKIHVATMDDVQRVLARMGATPIDAPPPRRPPKVLLLTSLLACALLVALSLAAFLHFRTSRAQSFPYSLVFYPYTPSWWQFSPGDLIAVTSVKGDRKHIEPGGSYLIEGIYWLASMDRAGLSLSITAPSRDSPGAIGPMQAGQQTEVARGVGRFSLWETMKYPGSFHVSFNPIGGGESRGTVYFGEEPVPAAETALKNPTHSDVTIVISMDGTLTFNGKATSDEQLGDLLKKAFDGNPDANVLIKATDATHLERLKFVWDSCRRIGLKKIRIQTR